MFHSATTTPTFTSSLSKSDVNNGGWTVQRPLVCTLPTVPPATVPVGRLLHQAPQPEQQRAQSHPLDPEAAHSTKSAAAALPLREGTADPTDGDGLSALRLGSFVGERDAGQGLATRFRPQDVEGDGDVGHVLVMGDRLSSNGAAAADQDGARLTLGPPRQTPTMMLPGLQQAAVGPDPRIHHGTDLCMDLDLNHLQDQQLPPRAAKPAAGKRSRSPDQDLS